MQKLNEEPLLTETDGRFVVFPISYNSIWQHYKDAHEQFWTTEQFDLLVDSDDWISFSAAEKNLLTQTAVFLATFNRVASEILVETLATEIKIPEARAFYGFHIAMLNMHLEVFSLLIDMYVKDSGLKKKLANSTKQNDNSKKKFAWINKILKNPKESYPTRIVSFSIIESIFLAGSFATLCCLKKRGLCLGLSSAIERIRRDKVIHVKFGCEIHNTLAFPCQSEQVNELVKEAVALEKEFAVKILSAELIGLNPKEVSEYIEFVADELLVWLNFPKMFNAVNPFPHMLLSSEKTTKPNVGVEVGRSIVAECLDEDDFNIGEDF
jgi:ribonucleotide reductase beta subunit family protein with ferritin-like domain